MNSSTKTMWDSIREMGSFEDTYYDQSIEKNMKDALGLPENADLRELESEAVLSAFFNVMSPFSLMYEDILRLYEICRVNSGKTNIEIEIIPENLDSTRIQMENFIEAIEKLETIRSQQKLAYLSSKALTKLLELCGEECQEKQGINDAQYNRWVEEYYGQKDRWPEGKLDYERIARGLPIEEALIKGYAFWKRLFLFYRMSGIDRENWQVDQVKDPSARALLQPEANHCLQRILSKLYYIAESYQCSPESQEKVREQLQDFLSEYRETTEYVDETTKSWETFLKLPVWKKRYEVYSIWIFSKIVSAFDESELIFHVEDGKLTFPFSGKCLATLKLNNRQLDIWTELKTKAIIKPIGKGRKDGIKPDYSIVCGDSKQIEDTVVVVECKQYKRASAENFTAAIIDYAANRPNAKVLLVDYGAINLSKESMETVEKSRASGRYSMYSAYRPDNRQGDAVLKDMRDVLYQYADAFDVSDRNRIRFQLSWCGGGEHCDLDLYLYWIRDGVCRELSYAKDEVDGADFGGDVTCSPGTEKNGIEDWEPGVYELWVNCYSSECSLEAAKPSLMVEGDHISKEIQLKMPERREGDEKFLWWHVLTIDTRTGRGCIVNELHEKGRSETRWHGSAK